jgi:hypothetical protein
VETTSIAGSSSSHSGCARLVGGPERRAGRPSSAPRHRASAAGYGRRRGRPVDPAEPPDGARPPHLRPLRHDVPPAARRPLGRHAAPAAGVGLPGVLPARPGCSRATGCRRLWPATWGANSRALAPRGGVRLHAAGAGAPGSSALGGWSGRHRAEVARRHAWSLRSHSERVGASRRAFMRRNIVVGLGLVVFVALPPSGASAHPSGHNRLRRAPRLAHRRHRDRPRS